MSTLTITSKGQVTLRRDVLKHLGVAPGAKIVVDKLPNGSLQLRAAPTGKISAVFGMLKGKAGPALTIEEIKEITEQGWAGKR